MTSKTNLHSSNSNLKANPCTLNVIDDDCSDSIWSMDSVSFEGNPNIIKSICTHDSKLVNDKGRVKPEDRKEFGIVEHEIDNCQGIEKESLKNVEKEVENNYNYTTEMNNQVGQTESNFKTPNNKQLQEQDQHKFNIRSLKMFDSAMILKQMPHVVKFKKC